MDDGAYVLFCWFCGGGAWSGGIAGSGGLAACGGGGNGG